MEEALGRKKEVLPEIKEAYRRAKERAKEANAAIAQQGNLQTLKDQLVWAYVLEVEKVRLSFSRLSLRFSSDRLLPRQQQVTFGEREVQKENDQLAQHESAMEEAQVRLLASPSLPTFLRRVC
jgi:hypothetical protein